MTEFIDKTLNRITMYRLVLYYLLFLIVAAMLLSFAGILSYDPFALLFSVGFLVGVCSLTNVLFAHAFRVPANAESTFISALILALIIDPIKTPHDLWFLAWAGIWAMASKYIIAIDKKHLFNPVAFAVALTYLTINQDASWWVGNGAMLPFVLLGGYLLVRKLRRWDMVSTFLISAAATVLAFSLLGGDSFLAAMQRMLLLSPLFFFAFVILTEPLTSPATRGWRLIYGALVGLLFSPQVHIGSFYTTPEIAILIGNLLSYLVRFRTTLVLKLKKKVQVAPDVYDFVFAPSRRIAFAPGQYMEWTLGYPDPDSRGNRRYFTLASSPTEENLRLGVKFYPRSSAFKQALLSMDQNTEIVASQLAGDFTLPRNPKQKCVFIAGGIGITPFRSMIKYLLDTHQPRPIVLFYANHSVDQIVYRDVLEQAQNELGLKTIYMVSQPGRLPKGSKGYIGRITPRLIQEQVPDYRQCTFYVSGPEGLVDSVQQMLKRMGVKESRIKTDLFSGLA